jgi:hypothetical protein
MLYLRLRRQRRDASVVRRASRASERGARRLRPETSNRDPGDHQRVDGLQRGRKTRRVEPGERTFGVVDAPDHEEASDLEVAGVGAVRPVGVRFEDGAVYHTYSTYARGLDGLWGMYQWLDRAPRGRNEAGVWWRRRDEYDKR